MLKFRWVIGLSSSAMIGLFIFSLLNPTETDEALDAYNLSKVKPQEGADSVAPVSKNNGAPQVKTVTHNEISSLVAQADISLEGFEEFVARKPNSLQDVPPPSRLGLDQNGKLIVDMRVRNLFEHYLSAVGEEELDSIILRIKYDLSTQLEGDSLAQALALMSGYLQYRNHLGVLKNDFAANHLGSQYDLGAVRDMQLAVRSARLSFFSVEAIDGMFAQDDQYDDYMMARTTIMADASLSPQEKNYRMAEINSQAPKWISESYAPSEQLESIRTQAKLLRESGVDSAEIYALRDATYGAAAAERLEALDQRRANWEARVDAYRVELDSLLAGTHIGALDHDALLSLRAQFFNGPELQRIAAVDKMDLAAQ